MLFSNINIAEKYDYLDEKFKAAYKWLRENDATKLEIGAYPVLGEDVIANVQKYETAQPEPGSFETHEQYFDIQYVSSGKELFGIAKRDGLTERVRDSANDLIFYEEPEVFSEIELTEGDYVIVAPEDAHRPRGMVGTPEDVVKVVVKVKI